MTRQSPDSSFCRHERDAERRHAGSAPVFDHDRDSRIRDRQAVGGLRRTVTGCSIKVDSSPVFPGLRTSSSTGSREIDAEPWVMAPGGSAEAQFDVAAEAWYFAADRQDQMPFAVLLEVALQACGWMAAYMGSALTSDDDLKFRNLGGIGRQHLSRDTASGTLTTRIRVTKIASTAGMIIQHYEFAVMSASGLVYDGRTEFGFFHPARWTSRSASATRRPIGSATESASAPSRSPFPTDAPFPDSTVADDRPGRCAGHRWRPARTGGRARQHASRSRRLVFQGPFPR